MGRWVASLMGLAMASCFGCASKPPPRGPVTWYAPPPGYPSPTSYPPRPAVYVVPVLMPSPATPGYAAPSPPRFARVSFVGLLAGPGKIDGTQWDGPGGTVSREGWQQVAFALGAADPYAAAIGVLAGPTIQALEKPDCGGSAVLTSSAGTGKLYTLNKQQDTFTPQWSATWEHVPLDNTARIRVEVIDHDLFINDPMGVLEIDTSWIQRALMAGKVVQVPVHEQTNRQILFAGISAQAE